MQTSVKADQAMHFYEIDRITHALLSIILVAPSGRYAEELICIYTGNSQFRSGKHSKKVEIIRKI